MPSISALDRKKHPLSADLVLEALLVCESRTEYKQGTAFVAQERRRENESATMTTIFYHSNRAHDEEWLVVAIRPNLHKVQACDRSQGQGMNSR